jgi:hypothetical protein
MYSTEVLRANMIALGVQYAAVMHAAMYESTKVLSYAMATEVLPEVRKYESTKVRKYESTF